MLDMWDRYGRVSARRLSKVNGLPTATLTFNRIRVHTGVLSPGARVLDAGCGWGRMLSRFWAEGVSGLWGVDITPTLLQRCRELVPDSRIARADIDRLPFPQDVFDVTYCVRVLQYVPDTKATIEELARVTRPGGKVISVQPNGANPWRRIAYHTVLLHMGDVSGAFHAAGLTDIHQEYFGFSPLAFAIPGAELGARVPVLRNLGAFVLVSGTVA